LNLRPRASLRGTGGVYEPPRQGCMIFFFVNRTFETLLLLQKYYVDRDTTPNDLLKWRHCLRR